MEGIYSKSVLGRREIKNDQHLLIYKSCPILFLYWWGTNYLPKGSFMTSGMLKLAGMRRCLCFQKRLTPEHVYRL